ncbi:acyl CoA:acetate/3-ketoacid CoA transferase [Paracandidimonas soli]|uniref:acyl CoA:acetate/3-ketoacid CoA transferase n=1 Tax=Paracandidimonas soli TaxID=1917182 RepID=UPI0033411675
MTKIVTAEQAVADIRPGQTITSVGVIGWFTPDAILQAIRERFDRTQEPRDLTFYFPCGTGDAVGIRGMDHVAVEGLMKRIVSGSYINPVNPVTGRRPALMSLVQENRIEAYTWPIGASMQWLREVARRSPGYLTHIGIGTFIDPDQTGGRLTSKATEDLVRKITFEGRPMLFYPAWNLDVGIIRATTSDDLGNLSFEDDPMLSSALALAMAVKACGGTVIAQVKRIVERGSRAAINVRIPAALVDRIVVVPEQMMVTDIQLDPAYLGIENRPLDQLKTVPFSPAKIIARRASQEVRKHELSIFGFGASSDIPLVMAEDGRLNETTVDDYSFTTEHGSYGGVVMNGWQFSCNINPRAVIDGVSQFDLIDGGLCRFAALAFAQFDASGTVNVSRFGTVNPGAGGFTDIAQSAQRLVFTGTFTTGGLKIDCTPEHGLRIVQEGRSRKFVEQAEHVTYRLRDGVARGQSALLVTERAVFSVTPDGLILEEIAPGIDLRRDILAQMDFTPVEIRDPLPLMDADLFKP